MVVFSKHKIISWKFQGKVPLCRRNQTIRKSADAWLVISTTTALQTKHKGNTFLLLTTCSFHMLPFFPPISDDVTSIGFPCSALLRLNPPYPPPMSPCLPFFHHSLGHVLFAEQALDCCVFLVPTDD